MEPAVIADLDSRAATDRSGAKSKSSALSARPACLVALVLAAALVPRVSSGERLPVTPFTAANGLPHNRIKCIVSDSRGFLWFCTAGGLSRFDGERFVSYGVGHGLSHSSINDLVEAPDGTLWLGTNGGGVCHFRPTARPPAEEQVASTAPRRLFECLAVGDGFANRVNTVLVDRRGRVWAGTDAGLFRRDPTAPRFSRESAPVARGHVWALAEDAGGDVWVGGSLGLARYGSDGFLGSYDVEPTHRSGVWGLLVDRQSRLWIAHDRGVLVVRPLPFSNGESRPSLWRELLHESDEAESNSERLLLPARASEARALTPRDGLVLQRPGTFLQTTDGHVWIASELWVQSGAGIIEYDGERLRFYSVQHGVGSDPIVAVAEDRAGNLWLGSETGARRLARSGLVAYDPADGLTQGLVHHIVPGRSRDFYVVTAGLRIHRFDGQRFAGVRPNIGAAEWDGWYQAPLVDRAGEWWIPTTKGLYRFPRVSHFSDLERTKPLAVYGIEHGLPGTHVLQPFEDARGDLWFGVSGQSAVVQWQRASGAFVIHGRDAGLAGTGAPIAFCEDRAGNLWIGFIERGIARVRDGRFEIFDHSAGVPRGRLGALHLDTAGRLWIGSRDAAIAYGPADAPAGTIRPPETELARIDDPTSPRPQLFLYPQELLSGFGARTIAEDGSGYLHIGGDLGVQRLDPRTGLIRRYTIGDGLPSEDVEAAWRDGDGRMWFGTWRGIARLLPQAVAAPMAPTVRIGELRVRGAPFPIAELGEQQISEIELAADQNQIEIDFFALAFASGPPPRYQYRLDGADRDWGPLLDDRRVTYVSLAPGSYRFLVRAVTAENAVTEPATLAFVILRPMWQQPWFLALSLGALLALTALVHRARVAHVLAVERVRTRIATDLHDDIGASLSQIAVSSEVLRHRYPADSNLGEPLDRIAATSRELVDSMGDIVWAINPHRDSLQDLIQRMRRFASEVFTARGIDFAFHAPAAVDQVRMGADLRRHIFLVFKEAVTNLARHAASPRATVELSLNGGVLALQVSDEGKGFDLAAATGGHGLASMRARSTAIGAKLAIASTPGKGTSLTLQVPLHQRTWRFWQRWPRRLDA